jgi:hypothetical protein
MTYDVLEEVPDCPQQSHYSKELPVCSQYHTVFRFNARWSYVTLGWSWVDLGWMILDLDDNNEIAKVLYQCIVPRFRE